MVYTHTQLMKPAVQALRNTSQTLTDLFTYEVIDAGGLTSLATLTVTIQGANDNPIANVDNGTAIEAGGIANGTAGSTGTGNVLTNDTDVDSVGNGETKTVTGVAAGPSASAVGSVASTVIGQYGSIVVNADGSYTYTIDDTNASVQALRTNAQTLDDVFTYTVTDAGGLTSTSQVTVTIQGANDTPHDIAATGLTIAENSANGFVVGNATAQDVDAGDTFTYSLFDSAGGRFAIDANTGQITVANTGLLNYEATTSHQITVRVTDAAGAVFDKQFTVFLTDVDEFDVTMPVDINASLNSIAEITTTGTLVGITAQASDGDATNNGVTYSLDDSAGRL